MASEKNTRDSNTFIEVSKINDASVKKMLPKSNVMSSAGQVALAAHGYVVTDEKYAEKINPTNPIKAAGENRKELESTVQALMDRVNEQEKELKILKEKEQPVNKGAAEEESEQEETEEKKPVKKAGRPPKQ